MTVNTKIKNSKLNVKASTNANVRKIKDEGGCKNARNAVIFGERDEHVMAIKIIKFRNSC